MLGRFILFLLRHNKRNHLCLPLLVSLVPLEAKYSTSEMQERRIKKPSEIWHVMYCFTFCLDKRLTISWQNLVTRKSSSPHEITRQQHLDSTGKASCRYKDNKLIFNHQPQAWTLIKSHKSWLLRRVGYILRKVSNLSQFFKPTSQTPSFTN